ncbi:ATP-dependent DNA helicase Rep [Diplonema papillatum]|nr:ATP-dependent DNA helicase Rep [Diplonema papillatum]
MAMSTSDEAQLQCIREDRNAVMIVVAGPGSGKTHVICHRIAHLISSGVPDSAILCVTFTTKAAKEMQGRIARIVGRSGTCHIKTIHALGFSILKEERELLGYTSAVRAVTDEVRKKMCAETVARAEKTLASLGEDSVLLNPEWLLANIDKTKAACSEQQGQQCLSSVFDPVAARESLLDVEKVVKIYNSLLIESNYCDFSDMVARPLQLLEENAGVREKHAARFKHVLIDEFQDTSELQWRLLKLLIRPAASTPSCHTQLGTGLTVVGDVNQSIYAFRGANPAVFEAVYDFFPGVVVRSLHKNYRCPPGVALAAAVLVKNNASQPLGPRGPKNNHRTFTEQLEHNQAQTALDEHRASMQLSNGPYSAVPGPKLHRFPECISLASCRGVAEEVDVVVSQVRVLSLRRCTIGILCRTHEPLVMVRRELDRLDLAFSSRVSSSNGGFGGKNRHPLTQSVLCYLHLASGSADVEHLLPLLPPKGGVVAETKKIFASLDPSSCIRSKLRSICSGNASPRTATGKGGRAASKPVQKALFAFSGFEGLASVPTVSSKKTAGKAAPGSEGKVRAALHAVLQVVNQVRGLSEKQETGGCIAHAVEVAVKKSDPGPSGDDGQTATISRQILDEAHRWDQQAACETPTTGEVELRNFCEALAATDFDETAPAVSYADSKDVHAAERASGHSGVSPLLERSASFDAKSPLSGSDSALRRTPSGNSGRRRPLASTRARITVTTVHGAKGLEWDYVFLIRCTASVMPGDRTMQTLAPLFRGTGSLTRPASLDVMSPSQKIAVAQLKEERRLCYVAMTRAGAWLSMSWVDPGESTTAQTSPFVKEVLSGLSEYDGLSPWRPSLLFSRDLMLLFAPESDIAPALLHLQGNPEITRRAQPVETMAMPTGEGDDSLEDASADSEPILQTAIAKPCLNLYRKAKRKGFVAPRPLPASKPDTGPSMHEPRRRNSDAGPLGTEPVSGRGSLFVTANELLRVQATSCPAADASLGGCQRWLPDSKPPVGMAERQALFIASLPIMQCPLLPSIPEPPSRGRRLNLDGTSPSEPVPVLQAPPARIKHGSDARKRALDASGVLPGDADLKKACTRESIEIGSEAMQVDARQQNTEAPYPVGGATALVVLAGILSACHAGKQQSRSVEDSYAVLVLVASVTAAAALRSPIPRRKRSVRSSPVVSKPSKKKRTDTSNEQQRSAMKAWLTTERSEIECEQTKAPAPKSQPATTAPEVVELDSPPTNGNEQGNASDEVFVHAVCTNRISSIKYRRAAQCNVCSLPVDAREVSAAFSSTSPVFCKSCCASVDLYLTASYVFDSIAKKDEVEFISRESALSQLRNIVRSTSEPFATEQLALRALRVSRNLFWSALWHFGSFDAGTLRES